MEVIAKSSVATISCIRVIVLPTLKLGNNLEMCFEVYFGSIWHQITVNVPIKIEMNGEFVFLRIKTNGDRRKLGFDYFG